MADNLDDTSTPRHLIQSVTESCPLDKTTVYSARGERLSRSRLAASQTGALLDDSSSSQTPRSLISNFVSQQPLQATVRISPRSRKRADQFIPTPLSPRHRKSRRRTLERRVVEKNHIKTLATPSIETPRTLIEANILLGPEETPVAINRHYVGRQNESSEAPSAERSAVEPALEVPSPDTPDFLGDYARARQVPQPRKRQKRIARSPVKNRFDISGNFRLPDEPSSDLNDSSPRKFGKDSEYELEGNEHESAKEDQADLDEDDAQEVEGDDEGELEKDYEQEEVEDISKQDSDDVEEEEAPDPDPSYQSSSSHTVYESRSNRASNLRGERLASVRSEVQTRASGDIESPVQDVLSPSKSQMSMASSHMDRSLRHKQSVAKASLIGSILVEGVTGHRSGLEPDLGVSGMGTPPSKKRRISHTSLEGAGLSTSVHLPPVEQAEDSDEVDIPMSPIRNIADAVSKRSTTSEAEFSPTHPSKSRKSSISPTADRQGAAPVSQRSFVSRSLNVSKRVRSVSPHSEHDEEPSLIKRFNDNGETLSRSRRNSRSASPETPAAEGHFKRLRNNETMSGSIRDYFKPAAGDRTHVVSRELSLRMSPSSATIKSGSHQARPMSQVSPGPQVPSPPLNTSSPMVTLHLADSSRKHSGSPSVPEPQAESPLVSPPTAFKTICISRNVDAEIEAEGQKRSGDTFSRHTDEDKEDEDNEDEEDDDNDDEEEEDEENATPAADRKRFSKLVTPVLPASSQTMKNRLKTPGVMLPLSQVTLSQASRTGSGNASTIHTQGRKARQGQSQGRRAPVNRLPSGLTKSIFQHFAERKVHRDVWPLLAQIEDKFWANLVGDVSAHAVHAGRMTIKEEDIELLMRRQRLVSDKKTLNGLIETYLSQEYRAELIPMAMSKKVVPPMKKRKR